MTEATGSGASGREERDADLVRLEGLESELGELDAELAQAERDDEDERSRVTRNDAEDGNAAAEPT